MINNSEAKGRRCDRCDKPAIWVLRARTKFLCEEHRMELEWRQAATKEQLQQDEMNKLLGA